MKKFNFSLATLLIYFTTVSQTSINVSNTVTNPNPIPFGLNWSEGIQAEV